MAGGDVPGFAALIGQAVPVKVVDIGANPIDGEAPYAGLLRQGLASVVGFEPNPQALARLHAACSPREHYFPHAIGDGARHRLRVCQAEGMTSLLEPNPAVLELFHGFPDFGRVLERVEIPTVRLDDVPETAGADLLKLDIQGAELLVLQHAVVRLRDALVVQAEVEFLPMYQGQPLFSEVEQFLRGHGFTFHRFFPLVSRTFRPVLLGGDPYAGMSQLVWADAVFVRGVVQPAELAPRGLLAAAALVHECYASYDLAYRFLAEHDRRCGTALADPYLRGLAGG